MRGTYFYRPILYCVSIRERYLSGVSISTNPRLLSVRNDRWVSPHRENGGSGANASNVITKTVGANSRIGWSPTPLIRPMVGGFDADKRSRPSCSMGAML